MEMKYSKLPTPTKQLTEERKEFLNWLISEDVNVGSPAFGILTVDESDFLRRVIDLQFYDMEERVEIKRIIDEVKDEVIEIWKKHLEDKDINEEYTAIDTTTGQKFFYDPDTQKFWRIGE